MVKAFKAKEREKG